MKFFTYLASNGYDRWNWHQWCCATKGTRVGPQLPYPVNKNFFCIMLCDYGMSPFYVRNNITNGFFLGKLFQKQRWSKSFSRFRRCPMVQVILSIKYNCYIFNYVEYWVAIFYKMHQLMNCNWLCLINSFPTIIICSLNVVDFFTKQSRTQEAVRTIPVYNI